jgi:hypothetical protein
MAETLGTATLIIDADTSELDRKLGEVQAKLRATHQSMRTDGRRRALDALMSAIESAATKADDPSPFVAEAWARTVRDLADARATLFGQL